MPAAEAAADPDMCGHLCPDREAGDDVPGDGLAAVAEADEMAGVRAPALELAEALAMVSPNARVAPSAAPPAAVPMRALGILTRCSFRGVPAGPGGPERIGGSARVQLASRA
jgi:hypothetical protein